jgi:hypothetical protein
VTERNVTEGNPAPQAEAPGSRDDEFFVGYLPTPPRLRRLLALGTVVVIVGVVVLAWAAARAQRGPEAGIDRSQRVDLVARYDERPYGILRFLDPDDPTGPVRQTLVVQGGKSGLPPSAAELAGTLVQVRGRLYSRDDGRAGVVALAGRLTPAEAPSQAGQPPLVDRLAPLPYTPIEEVRLKGEIVDSKCFFGSMRPGEGRTHRSCAQYCVRGGVPPVLVTRHPRFGRGYFLLVDEEGGRANEALLPYLAVPVEVRGTLERAGGEDRIRVQEVRVL